MWKPLKIAEQTYFVFCNFNDSTKEITFILYDLNVTWSQTNNFKDVKQKVKLLNKRFDFNEDNIKEALTSAAIQSAVLEVNNLNSCLLKLKYGVKNCLMSYEWSLKKQNLLEFQQIFVQPLLLNLLGCHEQIEILKDSVRKKDIELKQFRIEGAVLNRKTLVTKPFDFEDFNKKFDSCNKLTENFKELAKYINELKSSGDTAKSSATNEEGTQKVIKPEHHELQEDRSSDKKDNPRQLKRKANQLKMERLHQHLKLRRQGLEYESSQSQTPSSGGSQNVEEFERKDLRKEKPTTTKDNEKSKSESPLSLRKSSRCSTMKQKQYNFSTDDDSTDSEGSCSKTPTQKISTRCLTNKKSNEKTNSQDTQPRSKTPSQEKIEKKKLNNSNNFETKVSKNCKASSRVFDFSSESEDNMPLSKRKKSQKNTTQQDSQEFKIENIKLNTSILSPIKSSVISVKSPSCSNSLNVSSTPPIINEISSQLDNIKKELETLEAMRLADLKKRMCKV